MKKNRRSINNLLRFISVVLRNIKDVVSDGINFWDIFRLLKVIYDTKSFLDNNELSIKKSINNLSPKDFEEIGRSFVDVISLTYDASALNESTRNEITIERNKVI